VKLESVWTGDRIIETLGANCLNIPLPFMFSICILLLQVVGLVVAQDTSLLAVKRSFDDANVSAYLPTEQFPLNSSLHQIPETISLTFNPKVLLEVTFPEPSGEPIVLHAGIQLPRNGKSF